MDKSLQAEDDVNRMTEMSIPDGSTCHFTTKTKSDLGMMTRYSFKAAEGNAGVRCIHVRLHVASEAHSLNIESNRPIHPVGVGTCKM